MKSFQGLGCPTLIGSMPHTDREKAIGLVLDCVPQIPVWPQLPSYPAEQMLVQYAEGLPGMVIAEGRQFVRVDTPEFDEESLLFYEEYLALDAGTTAVLDSRFRMGERTAATFHSFLDSLKSANLPLRAVKGQIVGPFTLLSSIKDQDGRALIFDERFVDMVPKLLGFKARWQMEFLKSFGVPVIMFLDEPALAGFGSSAFITVSDELVRKVLSEVADAVHAASGLAGIHVCANTDWQLAFQSGFDIINFDSYNYFEKFAIYRKECLDFMRNGGNMAWGVVPTSDLGVIEAETPESLVKRWKAQVLDLAGSEMSLEEIVTHSLFTPSCGCGSLPEKSAEKVLELLTGFIRIMAG